MFFAILAFSFDVIGKEWQQTFYVSPVYVVKIPMEYFHKRNLKFKYPISITVTVAVYFLGDGMIGFTPESFMA